MKMEQLQAPNSKILQQGLECLLQGPLSQESTPRGSTNLALPTAQYKALILTTYSSGRALGRVLETQGCGIMMMTPGDGSVNEGPG
jgi:hypothetical protein